MARATDNSRAKAGIRARQDALQALIKAHQAEFDKMVEENRVRLGLPRTTTSESPDEIKAKLERAEERARKYREQLKVAESDRKKLAAR